MWLVRALCAKQSSFYTKIDNDKEWHLKTLCCWEIDVCVYTCDVWPTTLDYSVWWCMLYVWLAASLSKIVRPPSNEWWAHTNLGNSNTKWTRSLWNRMDSERWNDLCQGFRIVFRPFARTDWSNAVCCVIFSLNLYFSISINVNNYFMF